MVRSGRVPAMLELCLAVLGLCSGHGGSCFFSFGIPNIRNKKSVFAATAAVEVAGCLAIASAVGENVLFT